MLVKLAAAGSYFVKLNFICEHYASDLRTSTLFIAQSQQEFSDKFGWKLNLTPRDKLKNNLEDTTK